MMRVAPIAVALIAAGLCACVHPVRQPQAKSVAPLPVPPFSDDPVSFLVPSRRLPTGAVTIVRVCVDSDRHISSTDIIESSGDARFDSLALDWARSIRLRSSPPAGGAVIEPCGQVRVELRAPTERGLARSDTSLG